MSEAIVPAPAAPNQTDAPVFERGLWSRTWFMLLLCVVVVALDWELVPLSVFPFVFVFPVMLVAWNRQLWLSVVCCGILSLTRTAHQFVFSQRPITANEVADLLLCFFVLELLVVLTTLLGRQSRQLRQRVRALEGLLPICSFCKSIRNDKDEWERLENYVARHGVTLSHGLCPDCAKKHYGEFYRPKKPE